MLGAVDTSSGMVMGQVWLGDTGESTLMACKWFFLWRDFVFYGECPPGTGKIPKRSMWSGSRET